MHTKECLADALISAVQNLRDSDRWARNDAQFRRHAGDGTLLDWAELYLEEGTKTCICDK